MTHPGTRVRDLEGRENGSRARTFVNDHLTVIPGRGVNAFQVAREARGLKGPYPILGTKPY
jgi:hypothetical protein